MKKILLIFAMILLSASAAFAWTMKIKVDGISYQGELRGTELSYGNDIVYTSGGRQVGRGTLSGSEIVFRNAAGMAVGSVGRLGDSWQFRDAAGRPVGSAGPLGNGITYRDAKGAVIGESFPYGSGTGYKNSRGDIIGEADTASMSLRPLPLENWLIEASIPSVCMTYVTDTLLDKPAAAAGMRAGDFLIGWEGSGWTVFDVLSADRKAMDAKVHAEVQKMRDLPDRVMLVYRPAPGERGMAKGMICKLRPMPAGPKGFRYLTGENGPSFLRRDSVSYAEQIKKLYVRGGFEEAPAPAAPDPASMKKDTRELPGAHQELRESIVNGAPAAGWFWVRDTDGATMSRQQLASAFERAARERQPRVTITSYPGARIFVSTRASRGEGDPVLNSAYKFIGQTDGRGVFHWSGSEQYLLPPGAKGLAFSAEISDITMEQIESHPMITSLPPNTHPAVRSAMIEQVRSMLAASSGRKPEIKCGYAPIEEGKKAYTLK